MNLDYFISTYENLTDEKFNVNNCLNIFNKEEQIKLLKIAPFIDYTARCAWQTHTNIWVENRPRIWVINRLKAIKNGYEIKRWYKGTFWSCQCTFLK